MADGVLDFRDSGKIEVPVIGPDGASYTLREAKGGGVVAYRNLIQRCQEITSDGTVVWRNLATVEPFLISQCLYDSNDKLVPPAVIQSWPNRVQKALFARAKQISDIGEDGIEKQALEKALGMPNAPISMSSLIKYVDSLEDEQFVQLKVWLATDEEEAAKNGQSGATAGSD